VRESSPFLFASVSRQSPHPYRWNATWFVVLLIASVWGLSTHETVLGSINLLLSGLFFVEAIMTFRQRYWQRRLQRAESENERLRRELR